MGNDDRHPILIFVKIRREEFPDINSFDEAHNAPFKRTNFFYDMWNKADKLEAKRNYEGSQAGTANSPHTKDFLNTWFIDLAPDGGELLVKLVMEDKSYDERQHGRLKPAGVHLFSETPE